MSQPNKIGRYATSIDTGSGQATPLTKAEAIANNAAIDQLVKQLGGKEGLLNTLSVAADTPECAQLVTWLLDPRYADYSIKQLCNLGGLTILDLFTAYKKAAIVRAHLVAMEAITRNLLPVVEDVMKRAAPYTVPCGECAATGQVTEDKQRITCPTCLGHKAVIVQPDLDRQKVALELAQLLQKAPGVTVQQNTLNLPGKDAGFGNLVDLQRAVKDALHGPRRPLRTLDVPPVVEPGQN